MKLGPSPFLFRACCLCALLMVASCSKGRVSLVDALKRDPSVLIEEVAVLDVPSKAGAPSEETVRQAKKIRVISAAKLPTVADELRKAKEGPSQKNHSISGHEIVISVRTSAGEYYLFIQPLRAQGTDTRWLVVKCGDPGVTHSDAMKVYELGDESARSLPLLLGVSPNFE